MQKTIYRVAPGVAEINGKKVPTSRKVTLTEAEALYDLAHGRIEVEAPAKPARRSRRKVAP